jgi:hypothetical protein
VLVVSAITKTVHLEHPVVVVRGELVVVVREQAVAEVAMVREPGRREEPTVVVVFRELVVMEAEAAAVQEDVVAGIPVIPVAAVAVGVSVEVPGVETIITMLVTVAAAVVVVPTLQMHNLRMK